MMNENHVIEVIPTQTDSAQRYNKDQSILKETMYFVSELSNAEITFPHYTIGIVDSLKQLDRTGKAVRLGDFQKMGIKARSIYDHILSVAYLADEIAVLDKEKIVKHDMYSNLGRMIAYHEINEVLLGDVPAYTNSNYLKNKEILNEGKFKSIDKIKREIISNRFIWLFLNEKQRESIEEVNNSLRHGNRDLMIVFRMLDRIDPIICVWRYLYFYRDKLNGAEEQFIESMRDFFVYPKLLKYKTENKLKSIFPYVADMLEILTSLDNAKKYAKGIKLNKFNANNKITSTLTYLIENVPLFCENKMAQ